MSKADNLWLGITPTGWSNSDMPMLGYEIPFEQCVSEMALVGYKGCQMGHKFPDDPEVLGRKLAQRNLVISEPWTSTYFTYQTQVAKEQTICDFRRQIQFIKDMYSESDQWKREHNQPVDRTLKATMVVAELGYAVHQLPVDPLRNRPNFTDRQWGAMAAGLNELGQIAKEKNMTLCYHPHIGTGVQSREEIDQLMKSTDSNLVYLLLDTGHFYYADETDKPDENLLDLVRTYAKQKRIKHVHLKNIRRDVLEKARGGNWSFFQAVKGQQREAGVFTVPGDPVGAIDFRPILQILFNEGYNGWLVVEAEQDPAKACPLTYAQMAYNYLQQVIQEYKPSREAVAV